MKYIFDIDGTLTNSRQPIDPVFEVFFNGWIQTHDTYLVTGSDHPKTIEQVGARIAEGVISCFNCAGNAEYKHGVLVSKNELENIENLTFFLQKALNNSIYPIQTGNHIEERIGLINFSTIGRNCTQEQREEYYKWDQENKEREMICNIISATFPELEIKIGGQISVDICRQGANKAQILSKIDGPYTFFGDKTDSLGNDYDIALAVSETNNGKVYTVDNWQDTYNILKGII